MAGTGLCLRATNGHTGVDLQLTVLEASPSAIVAVNERGAINYVNPQAETTFGYAEEELVGRPIELLVAERGLTNHVAHRDRFLGNPVARPIGLGVELAGRRKDGSEFPVEISLSPVETDRGLQVFATVVDISARKAAEMALAESERRFRTALDASPNVILAIATDGTIAYANPRVEEAFGYTSADVVGLPLTTLLPEGVRDGQDGPRHEFMKHPVMRPLGSGLELLGRRSDGGEFPVEISLAPVETPEGLQVFATVVDITARKTAEGNLLQSRKLESIGRLAGGVAHDFNNILFAINGYAELLTEDLIDEAPADLGDVRHSVSAIAEAAQRGAKLTMQLLAFSRQQIVSERVVDPSAGIRDMEPMLRRLIGENVRLQVLTHEPNMRLRIDPGQLDQIFMNLVVNARDAMPEGGTVTIEIGQALFDDAYALEHPDVQPGEYVMVAVSDTGHGMDRQTREHIFEPFFTTKALGQGTGLGLATIYGIVHQAGGHIWLYSEPGQGSSFKLYFPRVDEAPTPEPAAPIEAPVAGTGTVLLVEDEPSVRDMTQRILERAGYTVVAAKDGRSAIEALEARGAPVDILVTDVVMPNMSGIELAEWMLDRHAGTAIVLLSGYTAETLDLERLLARGVRFVTKPLGSGEMLRAIHEALRHARGLR
jgi:PAS domain S-box-containing protein